MKYVRAPIQTNSQIVPSQEKNSNYSVKLDPKDIQKPKQIDQYHYCDDCDIAFKDEKAHEKVHKINQMIAQREREEKTQ